MHRNIQADLKNSQELHRLLDQPFMPKHRKYENNLSTENKKHRETSNINSFSTQAPPVIRTWRTEPFPQEELDKSFILSNN